MWRILGAGWLLCFMLVSSLPAVTFNNVVTLGDSLQDDSDGGRSPVAAEHVAERLGVPATKLAVSGSTSTDVIAEGQHTQAAAQFGAGDLAVLWIGGNDFFTNPFEVAFGDSDFLDTLEANVDIAMSTLDDAGLEIVVLNLPDMSQVPGVIEAVELATILTPFLRDPAYENITEETVEWNSRLSNLATTYDATLVDVFSLFNDLADNPSDFAILGNEPILNADTGCQLCVFFDDPLIPDVHPSSFAQGYIANAMMDQLNAKYDPNGTMPLEHLSSVEIALLADLLAGDFDDTGTADGDDLAILLDNFGAQGTTTHDLGDANSDQSVTGEDFMVWQRQFNLTATTSAYTPKIPEPGPMALVFSLSIYLLSPLRRD